MKASARLVAPAPNKAGGMAKVRVRTNFQLARQRFVRQRLAMVGLAITLFLIVLAVFAPLLAPTHYSFTNLAEANQFPSGQHWMGTDAIGHDYLSRVIYGVRTSLLVGFAAVATTCLIGIPLGLLAGFLGGAADFVVMRVVEVMTAFPGILFAIFLMSVVGGGGTNVNFVIGVTGWVGKFLGDEVAAAVPVIFVIGVTGWVGMCRLLRAQLLTLREQDYVLAARSIGATQFSIAVRHLLPNAVAPMIIAIALAIPSAIFAEAGLSFLGIGINEPTPSLGKMVAESSPYIRVYWHLGFFPTLAIALAMLGFTFVGDGLRDALDTRQR